MNAKPTHTPGDLQDFVAEIFASLVRKDQSVTSSFYLEGLMLEGRRKSMQPMAERLGIDHQRLQQFVSTSPWLVESVRKALIPDNLGHRPKWELAVDTATMGRFVLR